MTNAEIRDSRSRAITRLAAGLQFGRAWHTATVLPDGLVLVFGGVGSNGEVLDIAELFDPENQRFKTAPLTGLTGRAYHTTTVLSDGSVLIAGGVDGKGRLLKTIERWNPDRNAANTSKSRLQSGRRKATALLQADGTILLTGGADEREATVSGGEIYDPANDVVFWSPETQVVPESSIRLMFSSPVDGEANVDPKMRLSLRFSKQLKSETVSRETVTLFGPRGEVPARIISAEAGRLLFVTPLAALAADTSYNLKVDGPTAPDGQKLEFTALNFKTKIDSSCASGPCNSIRQIIDADSWIPSPNNFRGSWTSGRTNAITEDLPPLQASAGETALAGRVLALSGNPLPNVTLQVDQQTAVTDSTGRFLLEGLQAGRRVLTIQGHTANRGGKKYGTFDVLVDVAASKTTALPYKIWLPVLDEQNAVALPIPTNREIGVTTPRVPGMEVRVPAASVLRMPVGAHHSHGLTRRELTLMAITPIPADRTPFPLPQGITDGLVFTLQLHGAHVEGFKGEKRPGLRIVYPNYLNLPAGDRVDFWNYEPAGDGWYMYGHGTVTPDRRQVIPDPGVELQSMYCISLMNKGDAPGLGPTDDLSGGDPVNLGTGLFVHNKTDLVLPDIIPITLSRTYRQNDSIDRSFGKGMTTPYDMYIFGNTANFGEIILPDGGRIHFDNVSQSPYPFVCNNSPTRFYKAMMRQITGVGPNGAWEIKLTDGTIYQFGIKVLFGDIFGPHQSITGLSVIQDRYGNKLTITRDASFRMSRITSPNGRWIQFTYSDSSKRVAQATDNTNRSVSYTYDAEGRLWKVTDAKSGITEYTYDTSHRMLTIKDPRNIVYLTNEYDPASGRITRQTLADTGEYQFAYTVDGQGKITQTEVTNPRNYVRRTTFAPSGYAVNDTFALGTSVQQTYTYQREAGTNFLLSITDPLMRQTSITYDTLGNISSVTRLAGTQDAVTTTFTYEPTYNQVASVTDPLGHTISFTYDPQGRLVTVSDPLDHETTFTHNDAGQVETATDPLERVVQFTYESGDLVAITNPLNHTESRYFDAAGRLTRITNPLGEVTRYEYDGLNQVTATTDAAQGNTAFAYDPNGNLLTVTDARTNVTTHIYDEMDRVSTRRDPLLHDEVYDYDLNGNLTQVADRKTQITLLTYDPLDRLSLVSFADSSTIFYTYDAGNRITQITDSLSGTITYSYDLLNRLTSQTTPTGTVSYIYDDAGRRTSMTVTGQPTISYTYDNDDRLTQISQGSSTVTIAYDDADQRTSLTLPNGVITEYDYDDAGQITHLTYKHGANVPGDLSYEYDAAGRRTKMGGSFARSISPQPLSLATYNAANQQITFGANTLSYDLNGNLTSDGQNTYGWDARNQLTSIAGPEVNASFQYDGTGRRQTKSVNGATTSFLYDWSNILQEQSDQSGTANLFAGGLDEIFTRSDATGTSNVIADGLGSWLVLSDATGGQLADYSYGAFGQSAHSGNSSSHHYTGREEDFDGLYYYRARYYSPGQHRFLSEDPLGFAGGDVNLYAYVKNSPVNFTDPSGLSIVTKVAKLVKLLAKGGMKVGKKVDFDEAVKVVEAGGDVIATNRRTAGEIAREAGGGLRPVHDIPHGPVKDGYRPHYHPHGRPGGHVFYSIAGILAPNSLEVSGRGCTTNGQFISAVGWDIASGLDPIGLTDVISWAVGLD